MPTQTQTAEPGPQARYEAYLNEGRFMLQRDRASGEFFFYPRVAAPPRKKAARSRAKPAR
ncbi:hypothetical protein DAI43_14535 [Achromobacter xylosoxidans]|nr:hypothetical protein DAI43_14535 [Achromobacter xylosoxidans]